MTDPLSATELPPLDQIRTIEAEIIRKLVTARESSEQSIANARSRAALFKKQAHESGNRKGQILYQEIVANAEEEAQAVTASAENQAAELRRRGQARMDDSIQEAIRIILGLRGNGGSDEP